MIVLPNTEPNSRSAHIDTGTIIRSHTTICLDDGADALSNSRLASEATRPTLSKKGLPQGAVVVMDSDGEDQPDAVLRLIAAWDKQPGRIVSSLGEESTQKGSCLGFSTRSMNCFQNLMTVAA